MSDHNHDHGHGQRHGHDHSHGLKREGNRSALAWAFGITAFIMVAEALGGWLTNSLALMSDAGHMLSDTASLGLSLVAIHFAAKAASPSKSYGYRRLEILVALANGAALFLIAIAITWEAWYRLFEPPTVASAPMMGIAVIGLLANLASAWVLLRQGDVKDNLNLRSAYLHVLGDALGSVGAIIAGALMCFFGWYIADPIASVLVALLILKGAWGVVSQSVHILMEGAPAGADVQAIVAALESIEGVCNVHDVHVWTVTSGYDVFSGHIVVAKGTNIGQLIIKGSALLEKDFGIRHSTIQALEVDSDCRNLSCRGGECPFELAPQAGH
ncbi:MAG: zinc transporter ZitB [Firmicutes bacterium]|nr:zinc transporter ZitB [Bacillota bacterium]